ncbi:MAG: MoaD/ThiS family protein [Dehalococcoidales bacterium]|nr:MAG: MoaD/ThiS family protein [Dehalococcoidales bacterium]
MSVKINIPSYLQSFTGGDEVVEVTGSTIAECIDHLIGQFPDISKVLFAKEGKLLDYVSVYLNGEFADAAELTRPVNDGDDLHILYLLGGG